MPTNRTDNYALSQWERSDRILMEDFNADNAKIDAALHNLEERVSLLCRAVPNLAYFAGQYALFDYRTVGKAMPTRGVLFNNFQHTDFYNVSGGAVVQNGILTVPAQSNGAMVTRQVSLNCSGWTKAIMWLHDSGTGITPKVNGVEMKAAGLAFTQAPGRDVECREHVFKADGLNGSSSASITLEMVNSGKTPLNVYDYVIFFF